MTISIKELLRRGNQKIKEKQDAEERNKVGNLRGGSSGILFENGSHAGHCMAQAYLRSIGLQTEPDKGTRELMFEAGRTNEDSWYEVLQASGYPDPILREDEIPVSWMTKNNTKVTGRPDIVLCDSAGLPLRGIELKLVSSIWTARTVKINKAPKLAHLIQAGFYMWQLGIPFELWYTSRTDFECSSDFNLQSYPAYGTVGSEGFIYRFYLIVADPETGKFKRRSINEKQFNLTKDTSDCEAVPGKYLPFTQGFEIFFDTSGRLWYHDISNPDSEAKLSIVTKNNIENYYESLSVLKTVPKEPLTLKADGRKENFKLSEYCKLGELCCKNTAGCDIKTWSREVASQLGQEIPSHCSGKEGTEECACGSEQPKKARAKKERC